MSVPDFADFLTVHFPGGWRSDGSLMPFEEEDSEKLGNEYIALWLKSHMDVTPATQPLTLPNGHSGHSEDLDSTVQG